SVPCAGTAATAGRETWVAPLATAFAVFVGAEAIAACGCTDDVAVTDGAVAAASPWFDILRAMPPIKRIKTVRAAMILVLVLMDRRVTRDAPEKPRPPADASDAGVSFSAKPTGAAWTALAPMAEARTAAVVFTPRFKK